MVSVHVYRTKMISIHVYSTKIINNHGWINGNYCGLWVVVGSKWQRKSELLTSTYKRKAHDRPRQLNLLLVPLPDGAQHHADRHYSITSLHYTGLRHDYVITSRPWNYFNLILCLLSHGTPRFAGTAGGELEGGDGHGGIFRQIKWGQMFGLMWREYLNKEDTSHQVKHFDLQKYLDIPSNCRSSKLWQWFID